MAKKIDLQFCTDDGRYRCNVGKLFCSAEEDFSQSITIEGWGILNLDFKSFIDQTPQQQEE